MIGLETMGRIKPHVTINLQVLAGSWWKHRQPKLNSCLVLYSKSFEAIIKLCMGKMFFKKNPKFLLQIAEIKFLYLHCVLIVCCQCISSILRNFTKVFETKLLPKSFFLTCFKTLIVLNTNLAWAACGLIC